MQLMAHEDQSTAESVNPKVRQQILERNPLIRAMTDECQAFTIPILGWHLRKNTYFWVTILIFSLPFLYSCVYQMYSPGSPTIVYFDSCRVVNTTNPSYIPIGHVPSFDACADCNGITSSTNAAQITAQANSQLGLRFLLGVGSLLVGVILITMYVELGRFTARSLNLLSYGVYTRVPQPMESKKIISTLFVCFVFLSSYSFARLTRREASYTMFPWRNSLMARLMRAFFHTTGGPLRLSWSQHFSITTHRLQRLGSPLTSTRRQTGSSCLQRRCCYTGQLFGVCTPRT